MKLIKDHYDEVLTMFSETRVVGLFLQGSQNYNLDVVTSDVDTKCVLVPSFKDIAMNHKPISTTHIRENEEHIDLKDVRLMFSTFRKQNLNFLEILFTDYSIINPIYADEWNRLVEAREEIAHYSPFAAVKSMKGIAMEKYHAMEHEYPSKMEIISKYGYDPKQLHHLLRVEEYIHRYIDGEPYKDCLISRQSEFLKAVKLGYFNLTQARLVANEAIEDITRTADQYCKLIGNVTNPKVDILLNNVQYNIMETAVKRELNVH